jgi:hypothetical protein
LAWAPDLVWNAGLVPLGQGSGIAQVLTMGGRAGWLRRGSGSYPRWFGLDLAPVLPVEALLLQLLQQPAQLQSRLLQAMGVGG